MNTTQIQDGATIHLNQFIHPQVEPEVAFILGKELRGKVSAEEALDACSGVCAALEIIDSRFDRFEFTLVDVVADNCSAAGFVLSNEIKNPKTIDLSDLTMKFTSNGELLATGSSHSISGHPANSLVLLVDLLAQQQRYLPAGSIVLAGAATASFNLTAGMKVTLEAGGLGTVSVGA